MLFDILLVPKKTKKNELNFLVRCSGDMNSIMVILYSWLLFDKSKISRTLNDKKKTSSSATLYVLCICSSYCNSFFASHLLLLHNKNSLKIAFHKRDDYYIEKKVVRRKWKIRLKSHKLFILLMLFYHFFWLYTKNKLKLVVVVGSCVLFLFPILNWHKCQSL